MDKRNKRNEATDRKIDNKIKDRGDLRKPNERIVKKCTEQNIQVNMKDTDRGRGDGERKPSNQKPEKIRMNLLAKKPTNDEPKIKNASDSFVQREHTIKKNTDKDINNGQDYAKSDLELRKRIRDKYTLKLKSINKSAPSTSNLKKDEGSKAADATKSDGNKNADRPKKQLAEETTQTSEKLDHTSTSSGKMDVYRDKKTERLSAQRNGRRKPMIKTIMSKNGSVRMYKAVTFVDQKQSPTPLEINIPGESMKKQKVSKFTDTSSLKLKTKAAASRASIKEKPAVVRKKLDRKRDRKSRHVPSPDVSVHGNKSPPTEVARWAPSCIDRHTRPYYEAWVNTTLAAISKCSKKDKLLFEKQRDSLLHSFQRALEERPQTPELFYANFADERYTGRIKITQR